MADGRSRSQQNQGDAENARRLAEQLRKNSTPEEREQLRKMAEEWARDSRDQRGGGPGFGPRAATPPAAPTDPAQSQTEPVDIRRGPEAGDRPPERVLSELYSDKPADRTGAAAPNPGQALRSAAQGAERAIEGQTIPPRYRDLVRNVFRRYAEEGAPR